MATRFCGHGRVTMKFEDRSNTYRCTVDDGEGGHGTVAVGLSGKIDKAVDSPEADDEVAGAAISFACDDRTVSSDRFESDDRGWVIRRTKEARPKSKEIASLTSMEKQMLKAYFQTNYGDGPGTDTWVFDVIDHSGISASQARGVLSSLVKKGLIYVGAYDKDSDTHLTKAGIEACAAAGIRK